MLKVVIIDDEVMSKRGIRQLLNNKSENFTVVGEASDGVEGLTLIRKSMPDLVITDIKMPHMDGLELIKHINEIDSSIKTVIVSAYDDFEFAQRAIREGAIDYILKPVRIKEFIGLLDRIIKMYDNGGISEPETESQQHRMVIQKTIDYIQQNYNTDISLAQLAERMNMSASYFSKLFKSETGINYLDYLLNYRIERAKFYLKTTNLKVNEISKLVGYNDEKHFHVVFKRITGFTPASFREKSRIDKARKD